MSAELVSNKISSSFCVRSEVTNRRVKLTFLQNHSITERFCE